MLSQYEAILSLQASPVGVWRVLSLLFHDRLVRVSGEGMERDSVGNHLESKGAKHFRIQGERLTADFSPVANFDHALLEVEPVSPRREDIDYDALTLALARDAPLISSRLFDDDYEFWQNAQDPLEFKARGRDHRHLRLTEDPVFGDQLIDTSGNPGRRVMHVGFVEAVAPVMWLADLFWGRTGTRREALTSITWLATTNLSSGVLKLTIDPVFFSEHHLAGHEKLEVVRRVLFCT